jgi:predicted PhzF superfamily epimerase YddE/YHI9
MPRPFQQVDVFAPKPFAGNPLAVVLEAEGISTEEMQRFSQWTNLTDTTFLLPPTHPDADYRVPIFTFARELPFAGHPTLGSCHAWLQAGGVPRDPGVIFSGHKAQVCRHSLDVGPWIAQLLPCVTVFPNGDLSQSDC